MGKYEDPYLEEVVLRTSRGLYGMAKVIAFNIITSEMAHYATCQYCSKDQALHTREEMI